MNSSGEELKRGILNLMTKAFQIMKAAVIDSGLKVMSMAGIKR